ncbi:hypothetical protein KALB_3955 [Kutzneria albida DSM 43870]|uniref:Uncharacterized protein n=1 Tax=Kutzneria albida DSM 43870 TaxID=1449976 RepID=W5WGM9_9PSEU|nr:hypothetical protein KALB_3955 [Kutzneria albida DSM 43870]
MGVPETAPEAGRRTVTTPRVAELVSLTEQRMSWEVARHHREQAWMQRLRSKHLAPLDAQIERTELAAQALADLEKDQDLTRWARGADVLHSECYVRRRRLAELERCRVAAVEHYTKEKERLGELLQRVAAVESGMTILDDVTRSRVQQACAHGTRRIFNYWASFVRSHPQGGEVNERFVPAVPSPTEVAEQT